MPHREITASQLRADVYRILDDVLATGQPCEVVRKGRKLVILPSEAGFWERLSAMPARQARSCSFDELVETSWDYEPETGLFERG